MVKGAGKFLVASAPDAETMAASNSGKSVTPAALESFVLSDLKPGVLIVPHSNWHGWMSLEDATIVVSTGSEVYSQKNPDEFRVSPDVFGDVWTVKGR